jgi:hypothetical protein
LEKVKLSQHTLPNRFFLVWVVDEFYTPHTWHERKVWGVRLILSLAQSTEFYVSSRWTFDHERWLCLSHMSVHRFTKFATQRYYRLKSSLSSICHTKGTLLLWNLQIQSSCYRCVLLAQLPSHFTKRKLHM